MPNTPPYYNQYPSQQPIMYNNQLIHFDLVDNEAAVTSYPTMPNMTYFLVDKNSDHFYWKTTNQFGQTVSCTRYKFVEDVMETPATNTDLSKVNERLQALETQIQKLMDSIGDKNG